MTCSGLRVSRSRGLAFHSKSGDCLCGPGFMEVWRGLQAEFGSGDWGCQGLKGSLRLGSGCTVVAPAQGPEAAAMQPVSVFKAEAWELVWPFPEERHSQRVSLPLEFSPSPHGRLCCQSLG